MRRTLERRVTAHRRGSAIRATSVATTAVGHRGEAGAYVKVGRTHASRTGRTGHGGRPSGRRPRRRRQPRVPHGDDARRAGVRRHELIGEADGGEAALRAVAELDPDLVILDLRMPDLDGIGVLRALQRAGPAAGLPRGPDQRDARRRRRGRGAGRRGRHLPEQGRDARGHLPRRAAPRCAIITALRRLRNKVSSGGPGYRPTRVNTTTTGRIRVLVADDHPLYREAVVRAVRARPEFELIGQAGDGRAALGAIRESSPDIAVLDVEMPSLGGVDVVRAVNRDALGTRVVLLSAHLESDTVYEAVARASAPTCRRPGRPSASATP